MARDSRRAHALRQMRRIREIETLTAQRELAEARDKEKRMQALNFRTQMMAKDYVSKAKTSSGIELSHSLNLSGSLIELSRQAMSHLTEAEQQAERAARTIARLDHQSERLGEHIAQVEREIRSEKERREAS